MKERYGEITKYILGSIGVMGVVVLAVAAPGILYVAKAFIRGQEGFTKKPCPKTVARSLRGLQKNELIVIKEKHGKLEIELTKKGKQKFQEIQLEKLQISKLPRWDGKWRIVMFDIPDKTSKQARDVFRSKLKEWDFYPLQKSVWACPWPCENEIQLAAELYGVWSCVNIVVAEKIVGDLPIRRYFGFS